MQHSTKKENNRGRNRAPAGAALLPGSGWEGVLGSQPAIPNLGEPSVRLAAPGLESITDAPEKLTKQELFLRIRELILDGRDKVFIQELFQLNPYKAEALYSSAKASLTIEEYAEKNWPPELKREYIRAAAFKIAVTNAESDDPRRHKMALMAISHIEKDPSIGLRGDGKPPSWDRLADVGGVIDVGSILDTSEEQK